MAVLSWSRRERYIRVPHYEAISGILDSAQRDLPTDRYDELRKKLANKYWPSEDIGSTLDRLQRVQFSSSRATTPKRGRDSPEITPRVSHQRRATTAALERVEANKNLNYTYFTEDDAEGSDEASGHRSSMESAAGADQGEKS